MFNTFTVLYELAIHILRLSNLTFCRLRYYHEMNLCIVEGQCHQASLKERSKFVRCQNIITKTPNKCIKSNEIVFYHNLVKPSM